MEQRVPAPRDSTIALDQRLEAAKDDPEAYFELQKERTARRKVGKVDGPRVQTGYAGNI